MPKSETGEFELVLGNRQLLSGFAVVVILFGVFFAMGYIVGRNSTPSSRLAAASEGTPATASAAGQADPGRAPAPIAPSAPAPDAGAAAQPGSDPNPQAAAAPPSELPAAPQPTTQAARTPEAAKPVEKPPEPAVAPRTQPAESLSAGAYLQVIATIQSDAEVISKSLQERHFANSITPSSIEGRFRVLVGPYRDSTGVGAAKTELEKLGFHPILVKIADKN